MMMIRTNSHDTYHITLHVGDVVKTDTILYVIQQNNVIVCSIYEMLSLLFIRYNQTGRMTSQQGDIQITYLLELTRNEFLFSCNFDIVAVVTKPRV